jgi:hypothetical protein
MFLKKSTPTRPRHKKLRIKKLCYRRNKLLNLDLQHIYNTAYKRHKNYVNKLIKTTKEDYFKTKLGNAKHSYDSWQAINGLLNKRSNARILKTHSHSMNAWRFNLRFS